jgi:hypothetical protein
MKPRFPITASVDIRIRNILRSTRSFKKRINAHTIVVSSYIFWAIAAVLITGVTASSFATSAVVVVTHDLVVVAADSALKHTNSRGQTTRFDTGCKILKEGQAFFVPVGEYQYPQFNFYLIEIARNAIHSTKSIKDIYPAVEKPILAKLPEIIEFNRKVSPAVYKQWAHGAPIITLIFTSLEGGAPIAAVVDFYIDPNGQPVKPTENTLSSEVLPKIRTGL